MVSLKCKNHHFNCDSCCLLKIRQKKAYHVIVSHKSTLRDFSNFVCVSFAYFNEWTVNWREYRPNVSAKLITSQQKKKCRYTAYCRTSVCKGFFCSRHFEQTERALTSKRTINKRATDEREEIERIIWVEYNQWNRMPFANIRAKLKRKISWNNRRSFHMECLKIPVDFMYRNFCQIFGLQFY